jgi:hypothetical protein
MTGRCWYVSAAKFCVGPLDEIELKATAIHLKKFSISRSQHRAEQWDAKRYLQNRMIQAKIPICSAK